MSEVQDDELAVALFQQIIIKETRNVYFLGHAPTRIVKISESSRHQA